MIDYSSYKKTNIWAVLENAKMVYMSWSGGGEGNRKNIPKKVVSF